MVQLLPEEDTITELDELKRTTSKPKWIFEIFHGEYVHGIHQTHNGSTKQEGCTDGKAQRIEMLDGEQVIKVTFSGLIKHEGYFIGSIRWMVKKQNRQVFKSIKAMDEELLASEDIKLSELKGEELENHFKLSNLCLLTNKGHKHGPFGTNIFARNPVSISIDEGNVLAHLTLNFIYANEDRKPVTISNDTCFSFYVSFESHELM